MRVLVVGPGAVGSMVGGLLAIGGHEVTLLGKDGAPELSPRSLTIHAPGRARQVVGVRATASVSALEGAPDLIVLAVRQVDLAAALESVAAWPAAPALTIQNGIGAEELAAATRPNAPLIAASLTAPVEVDESGEIHWLSRGGLGLSPVQGPGAARTASADLAVALVADLRRAFESGGLRTAVFADAPSMKWSKLLANLVGNAISALLDVDPAAIYASPRLFRIEQRQLREAVSVMRVMGLRTVHLPGADARLLALAARLPAWFVRPFMARAIRGARGGKMPSLRLHLRQGTGRSEVAWLNGAVAAAGRRIGVATPVNAALTALVEAATAEDGGAGAFRHDPAALLEAIAEQSDKARVGPP